MRRRETLAKGKQSAAQAGRACGRPDAKLSRAPYAAASSQRCGRAGAAAGAMAGAAASAGITLRLPGFSAAPIQFTREFWNTRRTLRLLWAFVVVAVLVSFTGARAAAANAVRVRKRRTRVLLCRGAAALHALRASADAHHAHGFVSLACFAPCARDTRSVRHNCVRGFRAVSRRCAAADAPLRPAARSADRAVLARPCALPRRAAESGVRHQHRLHLSHRWAPSATALAPGPYRTRPGAPHGVAAAARFGSDAHSFGAAPGCCAYAAD